MRVLHVIESLARGGAERSLAAMAPHYLEKGVVLDVAYFFERQGFRNDLLRTGVSLFPLTSARGRLGRTRELRRLIRERSPDLVHTTLFEADIAGRVASALSGVPVVSSLVNVAYGPEQFRDPRLVWWKLRGAQIVDSITARRVVRFHAVSSHVADVMARRLRIRREQIEVIPRGRNQKELGARTEHRRTEARLRLGVSAETALILAVARHEHQKGLDILLEAMPAVIQQLPSARLVVAGRQGNQTVSLEDAIHRLALDSRVELLGARSDISSLLCAADVFAFPSRWEGLPGALLEAMALEVPIVASDLPSIREALGGGQAGRLVPSEQPEKVAEAIVDALNHRDETAKQVDSARRRFESHFTANRVARQMVDFYKRALTDRSPNIRATTVPKAGPL
jgi:glycosyltransferase involved in cell wall biosynthesis